MCIGGTEGNGAWDLRVEGFCNLVGVVHMGGTDVKFTVLYSSFQVFIHFWFAFPTLLLSSV